MEETHLPQGRYDSVITERVAQKLKQLDAEKAELGDERMPEMLSRHLRKVAARVLAEIDDPEQRLSILNEAIAELGADQDRIVSPERLVAVHRRHALGADLFYAAEPATPLAEVALLTNAPGEPSVGAELRSELRSVDRVDLLCAFIKHTGLRTMSADLERIARLKVPFRVITTTYMGASDRRALDDLVRRYGAEVRIQYEVLRTRLHAKSWLFSRNSGFDTAYVGSSNLSSAALVDGLEWNVRLSSEVTPSLIEKFRATFNTYWTDPSFEPYDPDTDADRLDDALARARGGERVIAPRIRTDGLGPQPYPFQREILEILAAERMVHDKHRNLIVAATGTGKTMIAAFDYRTLCEQAARERGGYRPSLLFVAHRKEILRQARDAYRAVLGDPNFGDLYVDGAKPRQWRHLFASIQTLNARELDRLEPDSFDVVVVDEFHHAPAASYRAVLESLQPREFLGLTATPERADGLDVYHYFGGRSAAEIRLWDALRAELLCPFHYFGISDGTDLSVIRWSRGRYSNSDLEALYTGHDARLRIILSSVQEKVTDVHRMRALGFCVGVQHAEFMARAFCERGIPAVALSGVTPADQRVQAVEDLKSGRINVIFTVDLFNEGVDIPEIDTVMFLRPTESATVFLQQLGRGLRRTRGKSVLTVLDFVGHHRADFRFDQRFTALTGKPRGRLPHEIEAGFPYLPSGCQILLDEETQESVLNNIRRQIRYWWKDVVADAKLLGPTTLSEFLEAAGREFRDVYRHSKKGSVRTWTTAREDAGLPVPKKGPHHDAWVQRVARFRHVDDAERYRVYRSLVSDDAPVYSELSAVEQGWARMFVFNLWPALEAGSDYETALAQLRGEPALRAELAEVLDLAMEQAHHVPGRLEGELAFTPLRTHAQYTREELGAALGYFHAGRLPETLREGVFFVPEINTDAFLVTLNKSDTEFTPTTMYRDYAISPRLFHWESQSRTTQESPTGRRYITGDSNVLLFVRASKRDDLNGGAPYRLLGQAQPVDYAGERPIALTYRLQREMPADIFAAASAVTG